MYRLHFFRDIDNPVVKVDYVFINNRLVEVIPRKRNVLTVFFYGNVHCRQVGISVYEYLYSELIADIQNFIGFRRADRADKYIIKSGFFIIAVCFCRCFGRNPSAQSKRFGLHTFIIGKHYRRSFVSAAAFRATCRGKSAESQRQTYTEYSF